MPSSTSSVRAPGRLRTELLWVIAIKLALVLGIKHALFNQPMPPKAREQAIEAMLRPEDRSQVAQRDHALPQTKETQHDQRASR